MTDPTGICFLSYKRERAAEAALLIDALHDHGLPTWQDVSDLPHTVTETYLEKVLGDEATSGAIMLVTPEVAHSEMIRRIEAPAILKRVRKSDAFFAVPLAAGGLDYGDVGPTLGVMTGLTNMSGFNIVKAGADPFDGAFAATVARAALVERLVAVTASLPSSAPLRVQVSTRVPLPKEPGFALRADLMHRFNGRHAKAGAWEKYLLPAFSEVASSIRRRVSKNPVEVSGFPSLPVAVALGSMLPSLGPIEVSWVQEQTKFGVSPEVWSLNTPNASCGFQVDVERQDLSGSDLALLVSATNDVVNDFRLSSESLPLRTVVHVAPPDPRPARIHLGAGEARNLACMAVDALRTAAGQLGARGTVHLFLAVPAGVAFMIGQQLNTFGRVQTYEHDPAATVPYVKAAMLTPSS